MSAMKLSPQEEKRLAELRELSQSTMSQAEKDELEALRVKSDTSTLGSVQSEAPGRSRSK